MRNHIKIIWLIGLIALMIPALLGYLSVSGAVDWTGNDTANHLNSKDINNSDCNACHWKIVDAGSGTGATGMNAHKTHVVTAFLNFASNYTVSGQPATDVSYGCGWCHQQTVMPRLYEGDVSAYNVSDTSESTTLVSGTGARKQVSSDLCVRCHGSFRTDDTSAGAPIADHAGDAADNCLSACHDSGGPGRDVAVVHGAAAIASTTGTGVGPWWIDQRYANSRSFCMKCHGGLALFDVAIQETNPANP